MHTIIVPTDFSPIADNALQYAINFAEAYQFEITLFHAVSLATIGSANSVHAVENVDTFVKDAEHRLAEKSEALKAKHPNIVFHEIVKIGFLNETLEEICKDINPIAVLMGITGSGSAMDKIIGSNAISAMTELNHPVIVLPKNAVFKPIKKICMACDLKRVVSSTPLVSIRAFAKLFGAEIHVLNVDYHNRNFTPSTTEELKALDFMLEDTQHSFHFIEDEDVQHAINQFVEQESMDMVIVLPRKHNFFESLFKKSQSAALAYETHLPLLALHIS